MNCIDEYNNDLNRYFKTIENEARELRDSNPKSSLKATSNGYRDSKGYGTYNNVSGRGRGISNSYGPSAATYSDNGPSREQNGYKANYGNGHVNQDAEGYQRSDFNRSLISYNDVGSLNIKHIFLKISNRSDLIEYTKKILQSACQDKLVLAIQRDNQLAESYAAQLRQEGFWSLEVTNKTLNPEDLLNQHTIYRSAVTTMAYIRDNVEMFQFPSVVINFDHVISHVKFLERFLKNRAQPDSQRSCFIYEICFNHSVTSQNLKDLYQQKNK